MSTASFDPHSLAAQFSAPRARIPAAELGVPSGVSDAMAVQEIFSATLPAAPVGYKVARSPDGLAVVGRLWPLALADDAVVAEFPWRDGLKIEVEIAVTLASALPPRADGYSQEEILAAIGSVHLGIEVLDSRIEEGGKAPYLLFLADRLGNAGYALGPTVPKDMLALNGEKQLVVRLGDQTIYAADARHPAGDVMAWLAGWASKSDRPAASLAAGEIITTGSLCGAPVAQQPGLLTVELEGGHTMSIRLTA
ncbi:fumarylacetoacetate hydrolase family protein [Rhizobium sp. SL42]|uniref:fumarylacetoacetate hydrolase family protein n=1 Tax=Rhizobium sp. SL42 TaxID=2806346 RepID=UPI001F02EB62|nr:fumarylacetoacetate hydrolase family protein [Rhizobium sp. SL42]UJW76012.1 fumarylacetoacetate hydrolase family protein [Rhizobium sp. SL42]